MWSNFEFFLICSCRKSLHRIQPTPYSSIARRSTGLRHNHCNTPPGTGETASLIHSANLMSSMFFLLGVVSTSSAVNTGSRPPLRHAICEKIETCVPIGEYHNTYSKTIRTFDFDYLFSATNCTCIVGVWQVELIWKSALHPTSNCHLESCSLKL